MWERETAGKKPPRLLIPLFHPSSPCSCSRPTFINNSYTHKGSLAYVGQDIAVMDIPLIGPVWGKGAGIAWKSFETLSQISFRNQCLVATDWVRSKLFGRDISRF
jgi:NADH dehydrogenase FAD-containing subunit